MGDDNRAQVNCPMSDMTTNKVRERMNERGGQIKKNTNNGEPGDV